MDIVIDFGTCVMHEFPKVVADIGAAPGCPLMQSTGTRPYVDWEEVKKRLVIMGLITYHKVKAMVYEGSEI